MSKETEKEGLREYLTRKYNYWNRYVIALDKESGKLEKEKEDFISKLKESPENVHLTEPFQKKVMEYQAKIQDANNLEQTLLSLYKFSKICGVRKELDEEMQIRLDSMVANEQQMNFAIDDHGFQAIDQKSLDNKLNMAMEQVRKINLSEILSNDE